MALRITNIEIKTLQDNLHLYFSPDSIENGRELVDGARVLKERIVGNLLVFVLDRKMYPVDVTIHDKLGYFETYCPCHKKRACKHGAAAVIKLLSDNGKNQVVDLQKQKLLKEVKNEFGTHKTNKFRIIPTKNGLSLEDVFIHLSHKTTDRYAENVNIQLLNNDHILIKNDDSADYPWMNTNKYNVELKIENAQLYIKCNDCVSNTSQLCKHQQAVLNNSLVLEKVNEMWQDGLSYDFYIDEFMERFGVNKNVLTEQFEIYYKAEGVLLQAKNPDFIFDPFEIVGHQDNSHISDENGKFSILEEKHQFGNALLWDDEDEFKLIKGKWNKRRNRLISRYTTEDHPHTFSNEEILLWNKIQNHLDNFEKTEIHATLKNNLNVLSNMLHFYQKSPGNLTKNTVSSFELKEGCALLDSSIIEEGDFVTVNFSINLDNKKIKPSELNWFNHHVAIHRGNGWLFKNPDIASWLYKLMNRDQLVFFKSRFEEVESELMQQLFKTSNMSKQGLSEVELKNGVKQIHIREVNSFLIFEPSILYDDQYKFSIFGLTTEYEPNLKKLLKAEQYLINEYKELIRQLHPSWDKEYVPQGYLYIHIKDALKEFLILDIFEKLETSQVNIYGQENLKSVDLNLNKINVRSHIKSGIDWFEAEVEINYGDLIVAKKDWVEAIKNNRQFIRLSNGSLGVLPEIWLRKLKKLLAIAEDSKEGWKISNTRFNIIEDLFEEIEDEELRKEILIKKEALSKYNSKKIYRLPQSLQAELRPYQLHGYRWMCFLDQFEFGGCLADDMGLGKTLQVLTFLLQQKQKKNGSSLVVVPRSLLFNWAQEIEKFTPSLTFLIHHGSNRQLNEDQYLKSDLIITTYDIVTRDIIDLKEITWNYIILDESQAIKNPNSKRYKAVRLLSSRNKIAMTGTPIENNTFDLYAQFSFLNPGIFGSQKRFKDYFSTPIDVLGDTDATDTLRKMIQPFLLRRTKEQVASDLPEKTESIIYCDMGMHQRKQYEELKNYIKINLQSNIEEDNNSKFMILDGLLKLRQICNSPELVDGSLPPKKRESVKIDTLINLITEDLGNHKALIFSQFVSMLSLIRQRLDALGIKYAYLDGSTRDRQKSVVQFMEEEECQLFLISIKAGNTGLNLTMADYVYIIDPWWNPAVEAQAIDRTHRIGQDKKVFAYRMICKDTIEEKILELQKKKKKLSSSLIQVEENIFKSLSKEELMALFN